MPITASMFSCAVLAMVGVVMQVVCMTVQSMASVLGRRQRALVRRSSLGQYEHMSNDEHLPVNTVLYGCGASVALQYDGMMPVL